MTSLNEYLYDETSLALRKKDRSSQILDAATGRLSPVFKAPVGKLVEFATGDGVLGTIANGASATLTTTLSPKSGFSGLRVLGNPLVEIYIGTAAVGSMIAFPALGAGVATDAWRFTSGFRRMGGSEFEGRFQVNMHNNSGATGTIYALGHWKYIMNNSGQAS